ncbi:ABC transporter permease [Luteococcus peritonei]|uniref:ABC transporter permease n=1 Tax=Luteococcus peritonei TaxID=88874 RepID=A0ABW4RZW9_9ACTN
MRPRARLVVSRLTTFVVSLLVASAIIFALVNLLPGDVATAILGDQADADSLEALRGQLGLDRPVWIRYLEWLGGLLTGDLGTTAHSGRSIAELIAPRLGLTMWLVVLGMLLAMLVAFPLGMFAAVARRRWSGFVASALSQVGMAVPAFLAGIVLVVVFAVKLHWLPANGYTPLSRGVGDWARHLVLPVVSIALVQASVLSRYVRSAFIEVLEEDWFRTARSVGWTTRAAMVRHGLRNAALSVVTVLGLQLSTLFVGAIVVESVFALPGLGRQLLEAVEQRELVLVQYIVMILVALVLVINALVDLAYLLIDPRLRSEEVER